MKSERIQHDIHGDANQRGINRFFESGSHDKTMTKLGPGSNQNKQSNKQSYAITFLTLFINVIPSQNNKARMSYSIVQRYKPARRETQHPIKIYLQLRNPRREHNLKRKHQGHVRYESVVNRKGAIYWYQTNRITLLLPQGVLLHTQPLPQH